MDVARIMENADLGIVPKRTDGFGDEAFSTKIPEFMALGVPVIVSDSKIDKYYFNVSVVKFFRGNDDEHLAECMLAMIQSVEQRETQARNAAEFMKTFNWDHRKTDYLDLVERLTHSA